ncbi:hypothetical protein [Brevibacillus porteri]|uniref:hypothetical protein n=1 Tax=Brevibacillus porteri TaxID=2126350 RepID=UPI003628D98F
MERGRIVNAVEYINAEHNSIRPTGAPSIIANWLHEDIKNLLVLVSAVINGYDIDLTPEEKLIEVYSKYLNEGLQQLHPIARERFHLVCQGIKIAVDELGVKIEGINS